MTALEKALEKRTRRAATRTGLPVEVCREAALATARRKAEDERLRAEAWRAQRERWFREGRAPQGAMVALMALAALSGGYP